MKFLKYFTLCIIGIIVVLFAIYYGFKATEYLSGGQFVDYLSQHAETVKTGESFSFDIINEDIKKNKLILVGEIHGIKESSLFDLHFFSYLHQTHGIRHYLCELDLTQAYFMNQYMESGDDSLLHFVLKNWAVVQGRKNKDYYEKFQQLHQFYAELPSDQKFRFIGIDKIQDWSVGLRFVNDISEQMALSPLKYQPKTLKKKLKTRLNTLSQIDSLSSELLFSIEQLIINIDHVENKLGREKVMLQNLLANYKEYDLDNKKVYGFFGVFHVFQYRINGQHPLASLIRESELNFADKLLSINFLYTDSYMVLDSKMLPKQIRTGKTNSRIPLSSDNILFMYIYGIQDFKRMTPENHKSLIKMSGKNNPYGETARLVTTYQILPFVPTFKMDDKGMPYVQYTVFVRNSDWAEPFEK